jgi:two-component system response regulator TtrR
MSRPAGAAKKKARPAVFLVDDDPAILKVLTKLVESLGLKSSAFKSAQEFLKARNPAEPGCLVLDVRMPAMSGLELQERLAAAGDPLPIIFVTAYGDVPMAVDAMTRGAVSFLEKPFRIQDLCDKIQEALKLAEEGFSRRQEREVARSLLARLTPAERRVLDLVVAGGTSKSIAEALERSVRTIEVHRARIAKKLGAKSRIELVRLVEAAALLPQDAV